MSEFLAEVNAMLQRLRIVAGDRAALRAHAKRQLKISL